MLMPLLNILELLHPFIQCYLNKCYIFVSKMDKLKGQIHTYWQLIHYRLVKKYFIKKKKSFKYQKDWCEICCKLNMIFFLTDLHLHVWLFFPGVFKLGCCRGAVEIGILQNAFLGLTTLAC